MNKPLINRVLTSSIVPTARSNWPVAVVALLSWISIIVCLDPAGSYPGMPEGPGLTVDELFNVEQGVYLVESSRSLGWLNLVPGTSYEAFRKENGYYNPDHPPLGRWWLGAHHHLAWWFAPPFEPGGFIVTACARSGSATAFALTVMLIGCLATAWSGRTTGLLTAIALVMMPRVYGHAHLASLETITNLTCTAAVLGVAHWWSGPAAPTWRSAMLAGILFGLALLTKIQAVLIPIPVLVWALWRWRINAAIPLVLWGVTALIVFFAGWPYLWDAPLGHLLEYLGRTTNRVTIHVWYFGQRYPDKLVPWHYPFVIFGLTVPVALHGLGLLAAYQRLIRQQGRSCVQRGSDPSWLRRLTSMLTPNRGADPVCSQSQLGLRSDANVAISRNKPAQEMKNQGADTPRSPDSCPTGSLVIDAQTRLEHGEVAYFRDVLLLMCTLFPLVVFALPGVAVYDGERLFLTSFPLWAIFVGRGGMILWDWLVGWAKSRCVAIAVFCVLLVSMAWPMVRMAPCHLNYYNEVTTFLMGGVDRAGLEVDYWGVGITRQLLRRVADVVPEGATVAVIPTLHQFQADEYRRQSPILREHNVKTVEFQIDPALQKFVLVYRRLADLPKEFEKTHDIPGWNIVERRQWAYFARRVEK